MRIGKAVGFTLIEMLIVIVIIGVLATALVPKFQSIQSKSRDTRRKTDLKLINNANEIYLLDNNKYWIWDPAMTNVNAWIYSYPTPWLTGFSGVLVSAPVDPTNKSPTGAPWVDGPNHIYAYGNVLTTPKNTYDLIALLENTKDPDRCGVKFYKFWYQPNVGPVGRCNEFSYPTQIYDSSPDNGVN